MEVPLSTTNTPFRAMIAGLANMGPVVLRGQEYTGVYLAQVVTIDSGMPVHESSRTPQMVFEFGRLVAAALHDKEVAEAHYRVWREKIVHKVSTDLKYAIKKKAVGAEANKPLSHSAATSWVRTVAKYLVYQEEIAKATEVWVVMQSAYDAAKERKRAIYNFDSNSPGGGTTRTPDDGASHDYYPGTSPADTVSAEELEQQVTVRARTELPAATTAGGPPPPPPQPAALETRKKLPPPPPPKQIEEINQ